MNDPMMYPAASPITKYNTRSIDQSLRRAETTASSSADPSNHSKVALGLERADREITQPQIGETALFPNPEQRPIERKPQRVVAALDRDADALAEIAALGERTADEHAAVRRVGPVEPERKRNTVAEQKIRLALAQRFARQLHGAVRLELGLGEEGFQIRLVRGAGDDRHLLAFDRLRRGIARLGIAARNETCRRAVVRIREVDALACLRRDRERGDDGIRAVLGERLQQRVEAAQLNRALDFQLFADQPRELDIEAGRVSIGPRIVERR